MSLIDDRPMPPATDPVSGTVWPWVVRGLLAGALAGLIAGLVAYLLGEPQIDAAIAIEESLADPGEEDDELVSRGGQVFGLFLALTVTGGALGGLFGAALRGVAARTGAPVSALAARGAAVGWLVFAAVPMVLYPANPPAVGEPDTIGMRTWMWVAAVVVGALAVAAVGTVRRAMAAGSPTLAWLAPALAFVAVVVVGRLILPGIDEVGAEIPAGLLWDFRLASAATTAVLWLGLGALFGLLGERAARR